MEAMTDEQINALAALAAGYQTLDNRTAQLENVFGDSIIVPGSKVNSILTTIILIVAMLVVIVGVLVGGFMYMFV